MDPIKSYSYTFPYLIAFLYYVSLMFYEFILINQKRDILWIRVFCGIGFLFLFGLRGYVLEDWVNYYDFFLNLPTLFDSNIDTFLSQIGGSGMEVGFVFYTTLVKTISPNYHVWIFISTLIDFLILDFFFYKYSKYYAMSFVLFFAFLGIGLEINVMRNMKAIMLFLLSVPFIEQRKFIKFFFLNTLGFLFHVSSTIYFILYFFIYKHFSKTFIWSLWIICNLVFLLHIPFVRPLLNVVSAVLGGRIAYVIDLYTSVLAYSDVSYGLSVGFIERNLGYVLTALFYNKLYCNNPSNRIFANLFFVYFAIFFCFSEIAVLSERIAGLFVCSYWILYPNMYNCFKLIGNKVVFLSGVLVLCILKIITSTNLIVYKYDNLLWGIETPEKREVNIDKFQNYISQ